MLPASSGSYGSAGYSDNLGMSFGVEKMVHLKAGWRNTSGRASMYWSDKYYLVDLALYNTDQLTTEQHIQRLTSMVSI